MTWSDVRRIYNAGSEVNTHTKKWFCRLSIANLTSGDDLYDNNYIIIGCVRVASIFYGYVYVSVWHVL